MPRKKEKGAKLRDCNPEDHVSPQKPQPQKSEQQIRLQNEGMAGSRARVILWDEWEVGLPSPESDAEP